MNISPELMKAISEVNEAQETLTRVTTNLGTILNNTYDLTNMTADELHELIEYMPIRCHITRRLYEQLYRISPLPE